MRVSREQAAASREKIIEVASRRFREHGIAGIGVADLMKDAGFTHGGFYAHFDSKDDLIAQACGRALDNAVERWEQREKDSPHDAYGQIVGAYLDPKRLNEPARTCLLATIGSDISRQPDSVRSAITSRLRSMFAILSRVAPGATAAARRKKALATYSSMIGAVVLARAVDDPKLAREILAAVK